MLLYMNKLQITLLFSLVSIIIFAYLYYTLSPHYFYKNQLSDGIQDNKRHRLNILDSIYYSTTIQSTIGLPSDIVMIGDRGRFVVWAQHLVVISTGVIILSHFYDKL